MLRIGGVIVLGLFFASAAFSAPYVITIRGVYLKNDAGKWVKIIEPDRRVDLSKEEAKVRFFNNHGRVPAGSYKNFRIDYFGDDLNKPKRIYSKDDFEKSISVKKGSFIDVSFDLHLEPKVQLQCAEVAVDQDSRRLDANALILEDGI